MQPTLICVPWPLFAPFLSQCITRLIDLLELVLSSRLALRDTPFSCHSKRAESVVYQSRHFGRFVLLQTLVNASAIFAVHPALEECIQLLQLARERLYPHVRRSIRFGGLVGGTRQ
jgi:hypothetical protein